MRIYKLKVLIMKYSDLFTDIPFCTISFKRNNFVGDLKVTQNTLGYYMISATSI